MRHGEATRVLAECNRNPDTRPEPYKGTDFVYWRGGPALVDDDSGGVLLDDPVAQSNLIRATLFGRKAKP